MRFRFIVRLFLVTLFLWEMGRAQIVEEVTQKKERSTPRVIDFSRIFDRKTMTREEFDLWKSRREARLKERLSLVEALEKAVDPEEYIIGPGDIFSFNIWGAMEMQLPIMVSPEGKLLVPSVGEIDVDGKTLHEVQSLVVDQAGSVYEHSNVTLALDALRFFRVHVVGEVQFPDTYVAQAVDRISEMITEAGGVTEWAWRRGIELRHPDGSVDFFNLDAFEHQGNLQENYFVNGGDVIYVPPIEVGKNLVNVKSGLENSGTYQIFPGEKLMDFLQSIRALKRNTDLSKLIVVRTGIDGGERSQQKQYLTPFDRNRSIDYDFPLQDRDEVLLPSDYVYVKGAVQNPGAYPFILNLTAKDYAGMAGGDFRSGNIKGVKVFHMNTGETEKGPNVIVEAGDVVHLNPSWSQRFGPYFQIIPVVTSLIIAAGAVGFIGK